MTNILASLILALFITFSFFTTVGQQLSPILSHCVSSFVYSTVGIMQCIAWFENCPVKCYIL